MPNLLPGSADHSLEDLTAQYTSSAFFEERSLLQQRHTGAAILHAVEQEQPGSAALKQPTMQETRAFTSLTAKEIREDDPSLSIAEANDQAVAATRQHFGIPEPESNEKPASESPKAQPEPDKLASYREAAEEALAQLRATRAALGKDPDAPLDIGEIHFVGGDPRHNGQSGDDDRRPPQKPRHAFDPSTGTSVTVDHGGRVVNRGNSALRTRY